MHFSSEDSLFFLFKCMKLVVMKLTQGDEITIYFSR